MMSMPSCMRPPRGPNPLVTGPETGKMNPEDGAPDPLEARGTGAETADGGVGGAEACAALICAARAERSPCNASIAAA